MPKLSIIKTTNIEAKNQPSGKPICKIPVNKPLNLGGDDSVTVVSVIGDCAPAAVNPRVLAIKTDNVLGAIARKPTKMGVKNVEINSDFFLPMRSVRTPT